VDREIAFRAIGGYVRQLVISRRLKKAFELRNPMVYFGGIYLYPLTIGYGLLCQERVEEEFD
jgi:hypothetical protein